MSQNLSVTAPRKTVPNYTFDHEPTVREMRDNIVRCMHEMLSVQWISASGFDYYKNGAVAGKHFMFQKEYEYEGMPYTDANKTIFGFLEYYDFATGALKEEKILENAPEEWKNHLGQALNVTLGNTCTGSTGWAYASTCTSVHGGFVSYYLVPKNGFYPVGGYTFDFSINNLFEDATTVAIVKENGEEKMMECYAQIQKADLVTMNGVERSKGHSMMSLGDAVVKRDENGKILPDDSYILTQDQRAGFFDAVDERGNLTKTSGRLFWKATFRWLFDNGYMPVTSAELMGTAKWQQPKCECKDGVLTSNYPLAVAKYVAIDENEAPEKAGQAASVETTEIAVNDEDCFAHYEFARSNVDDGTAFCYDLSELRAKTETKAAGRKMQLKVTLACGAQFVF